MKKNSLLGFANETIFWTMAIEQTQKATAYVHL